MELGVEAPAPQRARRHARKGLEGDHLGGGAVAAPDEVKKMHFSVYKKKSGVTGVGRATQ